MIVQDGDLSVYINAAGMVEVQVAYIIDSTDKVELETAFHEIVHQNTTPRGQAGRSLPLYPWMYADWVKNVKRLPNGTTRFEVRFSYRPWIVGVDIDPVEAASDSLSLT